MPPPVAAAACAADDRSSSAAAARRNTAPPTPTAQVAGGGGEDEDGEGGRGHAHGGVRRRQRVQWHRFVQLERRLIVSKTGLDGTYTQESRRLISSWEKDNNCICHSTMIKNLMHEGKLVSSDLIVKLILKAMRESGNDKFLVDGFPRNEENRQAYEKIIHIEPEFVLFIDCSKEEMERRILNRNQGRDDDNIDTIRRRFDVFQQSTLPVIQYYEKMGKLRKVDGTKQADEVFEDVKAIFSQLNNQENHADQQGSGLSRAPTNPFKRWFFDLCCGCFGTQEARN
uniref:adenylate kinase n=1 Tax=Leersia perrieri TaxID=77586 RepID=A0A0D9WKY1_9ORYZ